MLGVLQHRNPVQSALALQQSMFAVVNVVPAFALSQYCGQPSTAGGTASSWAVEEGEVELLATQAVDENSLAQLNSK